MHCQLAKLNFLRPSESFEAYDLYMAATQWSLADPIMLHGPEDIKAGHRWENNFKPFAHQVRNLFRIINHLPITLLADDVGLGKTISAGMVISEIYERMRSSRFLVLCPSLLGPQWAEEMKQKFGLDCEFARGKALDPLLLDKKVPIVATTYHSIRPRLNKIKPGMFTMLIADEAHKLRNLHGSPKPPKLAVQLRDALDKRLFKYVLMLTATPIQNRAWDLYSLIDLMTVAKGHVNVLGSPNSFAAQYLYDKKGLYIRKERQRDLQNTLQQYIFRTRRLDAQLIFPDRHIAFRRLQENDVESALFNLLRPIWEDFGNLEQISLGQALMSSPEALATQLKNKAAQKPSFQKLADAAQDIAQSSGPSCKLIGLKVLIQTLREENPKHWRLIVFTMRKATQQAISRMLDEQGIAHGLILGGKPKENQRTVEQFKQSPPGVHVIVSTDAGAEGVNLQSGNVLVNYDLPWNPMILEQRIGRIQRLGSNHATVNIINLIVADSVEEKVVARLMTKLQTIAQTVGDVEAILQSIGQDKEESFVEMVSEMVRSAMAQKDVQAAVEMNNQSFERAQKEIRENEKQIDHVLGTDNWEHDEIPAPKLSRIRPSMPADVFVTKALTAENATLEPREDDTIDVYRAGKMNERITFKVEAQEASSNGWGTRLPTLYQPGEPAFDQLVDRWSNRPTHRLLDMTSSATNAAEQIANQWCQSVPDATFDSISINKTQALTTGRMTFRIRAVNGVDRYEKIIHVPFGDGTPRQPAPTPNPEASICSDHIVPEKIGINTQTVINAAARKDKDIGKFCDHYQWRYKSELKKTNGQQQLEKKISADFTPTLWADILGLEGTRYDDVTCDVGFMLDGEHPYQVSLRMIPATGQILKEPKRQTCCLTQRDLYPSSL